MTTREEKNKEIQKKLENEEKSKQRRKIIKKIVSVIIIIFFPSRIFDEIPAISSLFCMKSPFSFAKTSTANA